MALFDQKSSGLSFEIPLLSLPTSLFLLRTSHLSLPTSLFSLHTSQLSRQTSQFSRPTSPLSYRTFLPPLLGMQRVCRSCLFCLLLCYAYRCVYADTYSHIAHSPSSEFLPSPFTFTFNHLKT